MKKNFPNWIIKTIQGEEYAFRNVRTVKGFNVAVRVGPDGLVVFIRDNDLYSLYHMSKEEYLSLEDIEQIDTYLHFEVGGVTSTGNVWLSDCMESPGIAYEDLNDIKSLLLANFDKRTKKNPKSDPLGELA